jgi:DNA-binding IclR family transcriptional regulator
MSWRCPAGGPHGEQLLVARTVVVMSGAPGGGSELGPQRSGAETARKVLRILLYFRRDRLTATVRELAQEASVSLPTAHRYIALLKEMGLVEDAGRASYRLSWRVALLGQSARAAGGLLHLAEPVMRRLSVELDETVTLLQLANSTMECIGQVESEHLVRLTFTPGRIFPLTAGASARVLLASLDLEERSLLLDGLISADPGFAARREEFERQIIDAHERGWAASREEIDPGIWAVAAPIKLELETIACLSVAGPLYRLDESMESRILDMTRRAAAEISETISSGLSSK